MNDAESLWVYGFSSILSLLELVESLVNVFCQQLWDLWVKSLFSNHDLQLEWMICLFQARNQSARFSKGTYFRRTQRWCLQKGIWPDGRACGPTSIHQLARLPAGVARHSFQSKSRRKRKVACPGEKRDSFSRVEGDVTRWFSPEF